MFQSPFLHRILSCAVGLFIPLFCSKLKIEFVHEISLQESLRRLTRLKAELRTRRVEIRRPEREALYLAVPQVRDFDFEAFSVPVGDSVQWEAWLKEGDIDEKKGDESEVYLAFKVMRHLAGTMAYACSSTLGNTRASLTSMLNFGRTDCGGHTMLFMAVMNRHRIPTRQWVNEGHTCTDIYVPGCGWVPVECTLKDVTMLGMTDGSGVATCAQSPGNTTEADMITTPGPER